MGVETFVEHYIVCIHTFVKELIRARKVHSVKSVLKPMV